jgi:splicing factor 3B subunit 3
LVKLKLKQGNDKEDLIVKKIKIIKNKEEVEMGLFEPRKMQNLEILEELESLSPITDFKAIDLLGENTPQFYCICGKSDRSSIRILKHGLSIKDQGSLSFKATSLLVFTIKEKKSDRYDKYIVISFANATIVLLVKDEEVNPITDHLFISKKLSLSINLLEDDSMLQVHSGGFRHIFREDTKNENKFVDVLQKKTVLFSSVNERQVILGLTGGEILYYELNVDSGNFYYLKEGQLVFIDKKDIGQDISALAIGNIPKDVF